MVKSQQEIRARMPRYCRIASCRTTGNPFPGKTGAGLLAWLKSETAVANSTTGARIRAVAGRPVGDNDVAESGRPAGDGEHEHDSQE